MGRVGLVPAGRLGIDRGMAGPIGIVAGGELLLDPAMLGDAASAREPGAAESGDPESGAPESGGRESGGSGSGGSGSGAPESRAVPRQRARTGAARRPSEVVHSGRRHAPVRLTRRGRVVVLAFLVLLAGAVAALVALPSQAAAPAPAPRVVVVQPGDSLWTIVDRYRAGADPVRAMDELRQANGLTGTTLYAGEELTLPTGW